MDQTELQQMQRYCRGHNSVEEVSFQVSQVLPQNLSLQQLCEDFLRRLVQQQPSATLQGICEIIQQQRGLSLSPQTMCKLLLRIGLTRKARRQLRAEFVRTQQATRIAACIDRPTLRLYSEDKFSQIF